MNDRLLIGVAVFCLLGVGMLFWTWRPGASATPAAAQVQTAPARPAGPVIIVEGGQAVQKPKLNTLPMQKITRSMVDYTTVVQGQKVLVLSDGSKLPVVPGDYAYLDEGVRFRLQYTHGRGQP